ncbi:YciI family protein [Streptomyces sp. NPDC057638]|uniref:YciI family protein n=1 Tax=Streptomyces sp. NPDC057638 TaxID=3346190 RepID=UPI0036A9F851
MPRFLMMVRADERNAPAEGPSPELMQRMGALIEEMAKAGVLVDTGGLLPTAQATRLTWSGGQLSSTDGPFTDSKEVVGGYAIVDVSDKAEALQWAERFLRVHEEFWTISSEIREIVQG